LVPSPIRPLRLAAHWPVLVRATRQRLVSLREARVRAMWQRVVSRQLVLAPARPSRVVSR
jgi:hypothetical protein